MVDATTEIKAWHGTGDCGFAAFDVKQAGPYNLGLHFGTKEAAEKRILRCEFEMSNGML